MFRSPLRGHLSKMGQGQRELLERFPLKSVSGQSTNSISRRRFSLPIRLGAASVSCLRPDARGCFFGLPKNLLTTKIVVALRMLTQNVTIAAKDSAEGLRVMHQTRTVSNPKISCRGQRRRRCPSRTLTYNHSLWGDPRKPSTSA